MRKLIEESLREDKEGEFDRWVFLRGRDQPALHEFRGDGPVSRMRLEPPERETHLVYHWVDDDWEPDERTGPRWTHIVRLEDKERLTLHGDQALWFHPTAPIFIAAEGTLNSLEDYAKLETWGAPVQNVDFVAGGEGGIFLVALANGRSEIWEAEPTPRRLMDLGLGLSGHHVLTPGQSWLVWYRDGRMYQIAPHWLRSLGQPPGEMEPAALADGIDRLLEIGR